mmetsp:Transcript_1987/g.2200  ORF Transcript_1987/g.2200 Transcript_1987/m.2200 type:complete len:144 (+) Transcript_1987:68-499(+)
MSDDALSSLLAINGVWHTLASYYFILKGRGLAKQISVVKPVPVITLDVLRALGLINIGYAIFSLLALFVHHYRAKNASDPAERKAHRLGRQIALAILSCANLSQFYFDVTVMNSKAWNFSRIMKIITVGDCLIGFADLFACRF